LFIVVIILDNIHILSTNDEVFFAVITQIAYSLHLHLIAMPTKIHRDCCTAAGTMSFLGNSAMYKIL